MGYKTRSNYKTGWGESKIKVMSNADRRRLGLPQDDTLDDYQPEVKDDIRN